MKNRAIKIITLMSTSFIAPSCSLFSVKHFDWLSATKNNTEINYVLLIGQNEHSDSIERTRSTREALDTRDPSTELNGNANLGTPKIGHLHLAKNTEYEKEFKVTELEHMEQKSLAGVVWDSITANGTTATWICKHGKKLTAIVSNNDGMAEGALAACNWIEGMPLFGYDANFSTLKKIKQGKIMGTVDQNAAIQTATAYKLIRNILEDKDSGENNIGNISYNPMTRGGFRKQQGDFYINGEKALGGDGFLNVDYENNLDLSQKLNHALLARNTAYTEDNISEMVDDKGNVKSVDELAWNENKVYKTDKYTPPEKSYKVCHVYNNNAEVYLQGTMFPFFKKYAPELSLDITKIDGDGIDESVIFNKMTSACQNTKFDAFLINMVTTTDGGAYIDKIANEAAKNEGKTIPKGGWEKWEDRLDTPVVFWNKQPKTIKGEVDLDTMNNKFFKYTYYVGVDAEDGGKVQGEMIRSYFEQRYLDSIKESYK